MDKQIATLEKLMAEWLADAANLRRAGVNAPWFDQGQASSLERCADNLRAAIALMRGQSEGLSGKVRDAKFGLAMIEVDCAYFGPHMIGPGDSVRIFVEQKAAKKKDTANEQ